MSKIKIYSGISLVSPDSLMAHLKNARTHSPEQLDQIAQSIETYGFTNPILADDSGMIIAGHGRWLAACALGLKEVPVITLVGLTEDQRRAYMIADNKIALNAGWNADLLAEELAHLSTVEGVKIESIGFSDKELKDIFASLDTHGSDDEGKAPEEFTEHGADIKTEYRCPSCAYEWSGKAK